MATASPSIQLRGLRSAPLPSTYSFAPGSYSYTVKEVDEQMRPIEAKLGQLGTITVK